MTPLPYTDDRIERLTWPDGESALVSHNDRATHRALYEVAAEWAVSREILPGLCKPSARKCKPFKRFFPCPVCRAGGHK